MPRYRREIFVRQGGSLIRDDDDFDKIPDLDETAAGDDRIRLIFTCFHAALSSEAQCCAHSQDIVESNNS